MQDNIKNNPKGSTGSYSKKVSSGPLDNYMKMSEFVKKEARDEAIKVYEEMATKFGVASIPVHTHNGIDTPMIPEDNVFPTNKLAGLLQLSNPTGLPDSDSFTFKNVNNITRISFHGYAANNASAPATQRASITGEVIFGRCFYMNGVGPSISLDTNGPGIPFVQSSSSMFVDETDLTTNTVVTGPYLAYAGDPTDDLAILTLNTYTDNSLTFDILLGPQWTLVGTIIIE